ncbi:hypothetical protein ASG99_27970 [Bacillus sp. Soil768D1]|nr:hypothetical protein ASG99_27970 [Bacillus sp. Soil768D1]
MCCPPATQPNEPPECEQRRQQINGDVFNAANGFQFGLINVLQDFPTATNPANPNGCEGVFGGGWHIPPIEELLLIENDIRQNFRVNGEPLCPMLIWALVSGSPTLVYVVPESPFTIIVVPTPPSIFCLAYSLCINSGA